MALELQLAISKVSADGNTLTVNDSTGTYTAENPTGYGAPNEDRAALQVFLLAERVTSHDRTDLLEQETEAAAPATADTWEVRVPVDGVVEFLLVAARNLVVSASYAKDAVGAYNGALYKSLAAQTLEGGADLADPEKWQAVQGIPDFPVGAATGAYSLLKPYLHHFHTDMARRNKTLEMSKAGVESLNFDHAAKEYLWGTVNYESALIAAGYGDFAEAGDALEEAAQVFRNLTFDHY